CSGNGDFSMFVIGRTDVDSIHVIPGDHCSPVGLCVLVSPLLGKSLHLILSSGTSHLKHRTVFHFWKKVTQSFITVGMDPAHQSGSYLSYPYFLFIFHLMLMFLKSILIPG